MSRGRLAALVLLLPATGPVGYERIRNADAEPGNWLTYSRTYSGQRYSPLDEIGTDNVGRLRPVWSYQVSDPNAFEATPLVVDDILYISEPPSQATALDARTGRPLWAYRRATPGDARVCCGQVNRGLALADESVFLGTVDAHLVSLDRRTGRVRWDVEVADYRTGHSITAAPLAVKDKIVVGIAGGEYGVRGFIDAYDARTGRRAWRFWTVPGPGEPGHETWAGESWKTGSATAWVTGSYDPDLDLIYWGTGNPGPDYNGAGREGANLYSESLLALDAATGKLRWHFQFTPHDTHDWDSNHVPVLLDADFGGRMRRLVLVANRNAFYYALDRTSGEFLAGAPFARQTWARGLDTKGRPMRLPDTDPTPSGTVVYPGLHGGTNWGSPSYSPKTGYLYVSVREEGTLFYSGTPQYRPGDYFSAGGFRGLSGVEPSGAIKALRVATGQMAWEFELHSPPWAGVMATAGGLVFGGSNEGFVFALDAQTGRPLWRFGTGGAVLSNPISYLHAGRQHVAVAAGHALFALALETR